MSRGVDGEETWTHDLSSHPGTNRVCLLLQLPEDNWNVRQRRVPNMS